MPERYKTLYTWMPEHPYVRLIVAVKEKTIYVNAAADAQAKIICMIW